MRKVILKKFGASCVFETCEVEHKPLAPGHVRVKVAFSGVNFADIVMRQGLYPDAPSLPFTPGYEISGTIEQVTKECRLNVGDKILAGTKFGGYSSHVDLPENQVRPLPENWSLEKGASCVVSFLTAYISLFELGRVRKEDRVLIDCASGSLGRMCASMLRQFGVQNLVGLSSNEKKFPLLRENGYEPFFHGTEPGEFHIILNSRGGASIRENYESLVPTGRIVMVGASDMIAPGKKNWMKVLKTFFHMPKFSSIDLLNDSKGVLGLNVLRLFDRPEYLVGLLNKLNDFEIPDLTDKVFDASDVGEAHNYVEGRQSCGKVLLQW